ncbi:MAG: ribosome silencing factor [Vicinamibacterales bacterium]|nr:ribosome silencing factor [Vicinamibacterales bacterium]
MSKRSSESPLAEVPEAVRLALRAAFSKKAEHVTVLDLRKKAAFTDFFVICSGQNPRQVKAIVDAIEDVLRKSGIKPLHIEGYERAEWVLLDGFDFIVHVFTPDSREFYSLERLWGAAEPRPVREADLD